MWKRYLPTYLYVGKKRLVEMTDILAKRETSHIRQNTLKTILCYYKQESAVGVP